MIPLPPPLWHFSKKSSDLVAGPFPNLNVKTTTLGNTGRERHEIYKMTTVSMVANKIF